ncbi:hypothetical protein SAMN05421809_3690 [Natronorubrum daqingense]|uniref:Uncharacterized protein n=1 Tax=Natronorubrum daqingense TaxID=588898 RepID=A0A1N7G295_9EURY|nr:hypothetical protein BB347_18360 [Natronorubrum daqingense]SIS06723.1 hypothetical protein SAMN05421809_3690 [Natronorubrum daqingense]
MSSDDTERENPLDRGDSSGFERRCDGCSNPTNRTAIPVRETSTDHIILCETCEVIVARTICDQSLQAETESETQ